MLNFWNMYNNVSTNYNNNMYGNFSMQFKPYGFYNIGYIPFNFTVPSYPIFPTFNFYSIGNNGGGSGSLTTNAELTPKQKAQIEEIRKMKYDSDNLYSKLDENKNINTYAKYLEGNSAYHIVRTIDADDGGKIYMYEDSNGNSVGSINKDSNGKVRNVSLDIADGGTISLNDHKGNDGIIDNQIASSKLTYDDKNIGVEYEKVLSVILDNVKDYDVKTDKLDDGRTCSYYRKDEKEIAFVVRDKEGKIVSIKDMSQGVDAQWTYTDTNGDGKISKGEEYISYDRDLSDK